jgi:hypothetical protein
VALAVFGFLQREDFPGEQPVWFLLWRYSTGTQSTSGKRFFFSGGILETPKAPCGCRSPVVSLCLVHFISCRAKSNTGGTKSALREILLLEKIQG